MTEAKQPVIYRDFNYEIFFNAKLSNFGLAKDGPEGDKTHASTPGWELMVMQLNFTSNSDAFGIGMVLLKMLTGRRSMDKNRPTGEHNLVEWARPYLGEGRRFYRLMDPRLEGHFSIKVAQKAIQLAELCLSRDPKARPLMSEVVEALKPLPNLKDMAYTSSLFQTIQLERIGSSSKSRTGSRVQAGLLLRDGQPTRSLSSPNGPHVSPYHNNHLHQSPKPTVGQPLH
ncbi:receptor-like serine/threonine-protein kinase At3g01300 [Durio zibethinus]|uniref:Receptor-like serine/threonine-protein kinase At3g01300 n=1 Tax=Durio zibethinus TaxID=66656 RepID=A0A6P5YNM1_DURZI|nr:receptor-like serine/threonine-protein kinase At3g01300 [Durio zibethinus]